VCLGVVFAGVGRQCPVATLAECAVSNRSVRLRIVGDVGSACTIQWASNLYGTNNWQFLTNLTPLASTYLLQI